MEDRSNAVGFFDFEGAKPLAQRMRQLKLSEGEPDGGTEVLVDPLVLAQIGQRPQLKSVDGRQSLPPLHSHPRVFVPFIVIERRIQRLASLVNRLSHAAYGFVCKRATASLDKGRKKPHQVRRRSVWIWLSEAPNSAPPATPEGTSQHLSIETTSHPLPASVAEELGREVSDHE